MHLSVSSQNKGETQTSSGYKQQQNQATSLLGAAATCGAINCSGHWMSLHCKGIKILQWNSFWRLPWLNRFLIPYEHFHIHNTSYGFFWFLFICLEVLVAAFVLFVSLSFLPDKSFPWNAPVTCNKAGSYHSAFSIIAPSFSAHRLLRNEHFKQNTVHS